MKLSVRKIPVIPITRVYHIIYFFDKSGCKTLFLWTIGGSHNQRLVMAMATDSSRAAWKGVLTTMKIGFDNQKYLKMQSEHIRERISQFGDKLYLEFGGKLFDDYHASRVLPGFAPDSKLNMLLQLADQAEIVIAINAADIEKNKIRHDLGITYDADVLRLIQEYRDKGLYVGSVVITRYTGQTSADVFKTKLEHLGIKVYRHYPIDGYPNNIAHIVSDDGYGKNDYIETTKPLVIITAPGPGSGKMATCLSQLYHENKRGIKAGYAKFETFPIWNIPLKASGQSGI